VNDKERAMGKFTQTAGSLSIAIMIAGLTGCDMFEKEAPPPAPLTIGGSVSGLPGSGLVLQLNGANDMAISANGNFKFPSALTKGSTYTVTVKTSPSAPVKQTCTVGRGGTGKLADSAVNNIAITCVTNSFAVGGTVSGLSGAGLALQLNGGKDFPIEKNGNFVFPGIRLPDGSDYNVAIKATPPKQKCEIKAVSSAFDKDTLNIVAVTCSKKGRRE
jgi:trimeric autotransporter adhesin